ncbi:MAG TPA: ferredoxin reductase family protein [Acidimicrobiales bacterium]|jgi:predicted ferric reductase|nr:ferredoxin reductase family protein [Acidimicrobiales bacterium]
MTAVLQERRPGVTAAPPVPPPAARRAHPGAVLAVIGAGAAAAIWLWWHDTPVVHGFGDWLTNAGRITGLLAGYAVVVLVALMARIPPLERGIGADRLARWHSKGGRYAVSLVVAHSLLIVWGYAVSAHTNVVHQTSTLLMTYPDVMAATVAGLLLVVVGVTSARAARRRLRYETWYYLHFYTYLAVALAFSHQFATGADFMTHPMARALWAAMYAAVAAAILWYRFITPIRQAFRHRMRVLAVTREGPNVVSVVIHGRHLDELRAESGQFFRWRFLSPGLWWTSSPYSLSAGPRPNHLRITIKDLGDHSAAVAAVKPGTPVMAEGPYGAVTAAVRRRRKVLLIGGGIGITPLRALFETLPAAPGDLTLLYRASEPADIVFRDELEQLARRRHARLHFVIGRRAELGYDPLSPRALASNVADLKQHDVYVCGPAGMAESVRRALRRAGVPGRQIHHESFEF